MIQTSVEGPLDNRGPLKGSMDGKAAALSAINNALKSENEKLLARIKELQQEVKLLNKQKQKWQVGRGIISGSGSSAELEEARDRVEVLQEELHEVQIEFAQRLAGAEKSAETFREEKAKASAELEAVNQAKLQLEKRLQDSSEETHRLREEGLSLSKRAGDLEASLRKARADEKELNEERVALKNRIVLLEANAAAAVHRAEEAATAAYSKTKELEEARERAEQNASSADAERQKEMLMALQKAAAETDLVKSTLLAALEEARQACKDAQNRVFLAEEQLRDETSRREELERRQMDSNFHFGGSRFVSMEDAVAAAAAAASQPLLEQLHKLSRELEEMKETADEVVAAAEGRAKVAAAAAAAAQTSASAAESRAKELESLLQDSRREREKEFEASTRLREEEETKRREAEEKLERAEQELSKSRNDIEETTQRLTREIQILKDNVQDLAKENVRLKSDLKSAQASSASAASSSLLSESEISQIPNRKPFSSNDSGDAIRNGGVTKGSISKSIGTTAPTHSSPSPYSASRPHYYDMKLLETSCATSSAASLGVQEIDLDLFLGSSRNGGSGGSGGGGGRGGGGNGRGRGNEREAEWKTEGNGEEAEEVKILREKLGQLQERVDVALEMLGERNERVEELEETLKEAKQVFWIQIEECVRQMETAREGARHWEGKLREVEAAFSGVKGGEVEREEERGTGGEKSGNGGEKNRKQERL